MSNTTLTTQQLFNTTAAAILADLRARFSHNMTQSLGNEAQGPALMTMVIGWLDKSVQEMGAGAASISVPVTGTAPPSGMAGFGVQPVMNGLQAQGLPAAQPFLAAQPFNGNIQGGLGAQPQQQQGQFGAPAGFGAATGFGGPVAPQAGNLPKGTAASLQGCGRCRVPTSQSAEGAVCGVAHNKNECKGVVLYCTLAATKQGASGYWTCSAHVKRPSPDLTGRGAKKSGGNGGAVVSPGQLTGLGRPTGVPPGFGSNPQMAGSIANMMGQVPQFGQPSQFGQQPFGQQQFGAPTPVANPALSNQLMNSVQGQVSQMPQQQGQPMGGFNVNNMLQGGAPTSLPVGQGFNPILAGIPSTPNFGGGGGQVAPSVINTAGFDEDDEDDDGESTNDEDQNRPVPQTDPNAVHAAMQAAGFQGGFQPQQQPQFQQQQPNFGGQSVPQQQPQFQPQGQVNFQQQQPPQFQQQPQVNFQPQQPQQFQQAPAPMSFGPLASNPLHSVMQQVTQQTPVPPPAQQGAPNLLAQALQQQTAAAQPPQQQTAPPAAAQPTPVPPPATSNALNDALRAATSGAPVQAN